MKVLLSWDPIAALATTGNVKPAARAVGRYANGAPARCMHLAQRKHPRGKNFAEAWD